MARDGVAGGWWYCFVWRTMYTSTFISHAADLGDKAQPLWSAPTECEKRKQNGTR